ncbi:MAG: rRNA pseudouridine synthase [Oscillospiraceae bacterium]|nr:rRNA pseudouridine synthase [Oscillospiraceae bacterium]
MPLSRIDKIISSAGLASRSEVKKLVREGRVTANGETVASASMKFDDGADVRLDGVPVSREKHVYIMMNKPAGYLSATEDKKAPTVVDLLNGREAARGLFPAGRLDKDSVGLLILTDDGDLCHRIISPKSGTVKEYFIRVSRPFDADAVRMFAGGAVLDDGYRCLPAELEPSEDGLTAVVRISEGKYRQVRRMAAAAGTEVTYLKRLSVGGVRLDPALKEGEYRPLTEEELNTLRRQTSGKA